MDSLSATLFAVVILSVSPFDLLLSETAGTTTLNYVTPNAETGCPQDGGKASCFTLEEYAHQQDVYFANSSMFRFLPGMHQLDENLTFISVHGLTIQGTKGNGSVRIALISSSARITLKNCSNIEILSVNFVLLDDFTFAIVFENTHSVRILNTSILGHGSRGCSSILSKKSTLNVTNSKFIGIAGYLGAAMMITASSNINFTGFNVFKSNTAMLGGALYLEDSVMMINASDSGINFTNNSAMSGGAIYSFSSGTRLLGKSMVTFANNTANNSGGAISISKGIFHIHASALFYNNHASNDGGAIMLSNVNSISLGSNSSSNLSNTSYTHSSIVLFQQNLAVRGGGAIESHNSSLTITKTIIFHGNSAGSNGGAISLIQSKLILVPSLNVSFIKNNASNTGGALYVEDLQCFPVIRECFITIFGNEATTRDVSFHFEYNFAKLNGSTLYGDFNDYECRLYFKTDIDPCTCENFHYSDDPLGIFMNVSSITQNVKDNTNISSSAKMVKLCEPQSNELNVYPGKQFNVTLAVFDMIGSRIKVRTELLTDTNYPYSDDYRISPKRLYIGENNSVYDNKLCANATFRVYSSTTTINVTFALDLASKCKNFEDHSKLTLHLHIQPCPIGFELSTKDVDNDHKCVCHRRLQKFIPNCYIDNMSFERLKNKFWISQADDTEMIIHSSRCPLDYCKNDPINVTLALGESETDLQCDLNRDGILCGQCKKNFSLALGSLHCRSCSNNHIALIVFFAAAGVALVALIFLCRLTVSNGTLNGLLFYSNILQANFQAFFPRDNIIFCTVFISWINLDFGIETCFYDGMDIYAYSWFQFLFPIYILLLVGCIILACHYSQSIAKRFGENPVTVLATLLLMSFSKILQAIIIPFSLTHLTYYNFSQDSESRQTVWLYDGSIGYFKEPKHIALGLFAIVALVVFVLPYIFLLFFGHWLQGCSNWWILSWLNKIKPFMDAYHAPYTEQARYWTGLLLLTRLGLFLTFAINANGSESINILAVSSISLVLLSFKRRVYEHWWKDLLESSFILNLGILSVVAFYLNEEAEDSNSQLIFSSISVAFAFITFIGIVLFHFSLVIKSTNIWRVHVLPLIQRFYLLSKLFRFTSAVKRKPTQGDKNTTELSALPIVTSTEIDVDLREPLIEITDSHASMHAN